MPADSVDKRNQVADGTVLEMRRACARAAHCIGVRSRQTIVDQ
jgi:ribosomal protein L32E